MKASAVTGTSPDRLNDREFETARRAIIGAYVNRGMPCSGRNMSAIFTRLRLTLFHAGQLNAPKRAATRPSVSVSGWADAPQPFADSARRYLTQVELSLRPNTVKHIDQALREFGTWLGQNRPEVLSCADLTRSHIEDYKSSVGARTARYTGKPLNRVSIKNRLINLHCFFDRITEWGYPNPPQRPLMFIGDLPIIDKPLPRFLDDAAATKLMRTSRADPDPLAGSSSSYSPAPASAKANCSPSPSTPLSRSAPPTGFGSRSASSTTTATSRCTRSSRTCSTTGSVSTGQPACVQNFSCWRTTNPSTPSASRPPSADSPARPASVTSRRTSCATPSRHKPSTAA